MTARQMEIEDYIVTPDRQDLDADSLFVAIREWKPGIRQLILEDYTGFGADPASSIRRSSAASRASITCRARGCMSTRARAAS